VAERLKGILLSIAYVGSRDITADTALSPFKFVGNWISDFAFDSATQKYAISFSTPSPLLLPSVGYPHYIKRTWITFTSAETGAAAKLLAKVFGGQVRPEDGSWYSTFDTGFTDFFTLQSIAAKAGATDTERGMAAVGTIQLYSKEQPQMFVDPYLYIRGAPESSFWNTDGTTTELLAIEPRTRPTGSIPPIQAYVDAVTSQTKTSLNSLRHMRLRITDADGNLLMIDKPYLIKLLISFNI
jgi:hypothetical protein